SGEVTLRGAAFAGDSYWSSSVATWPFGLLRVSPNELIIATTGIARFRYDFSRTIIQDLAVRRGSFFGLDIGTLRITHVSPDAPPYVNFQTFSPDILMAALKTAEYKFREERHPKSFISKLRRLSQLKDR